VWSLSNPNPGEIGPDPIRCPIIGTLPRTSADGIWPRDDPRCALERTPCSAGRTARSLRVPLFNRFPLGNLSLSRFAWHPAC